MAVWMIDAQEDMHFYGRSERESQGWHVTVAMTVTRLKQSWRRDCGVGSGRQFHQIGDGCCTQMREPAVGMWGNGVIAVKRYKRTGLQWDREQFLSKSATETTDLAGKGDFVDNLLEGAVGSTGGSGRCGQPVGERAVDLGKKQWKSHVETLKWFPGSLQQKR
ncbi:hypothetical protein BC835DRAFT_1309659 [Cytidiella melzeri]|nr:hypothetical protein BC835DRAFT_1309659 [Cytidiella melzeri]